MAHVSELFTGDRSRPIALCLLGTFRLFKGGQPVQIPGSGKSGSLLACLAVRRDRPVSRDFLLNTIWPDVDSSLARQSLNSLIYSIHKTLGGGSDRTDVILRDGNAYRLNTGSQVQLDLMSFDDCADRGDRLAEDGRYEAAMRAYEDALSLYQGDLCVDNDLHAVIERERLRARYLTLLARMAEYYLSVGSYAEALRSSQRLLAEDPCREDAHRAVMRCHVRQGERAQALRQYRLCEQALRREFDATPEAATRALFAQIQLGSESI
jgi:DNA-binding SARP family transcriptional activator